MVENLSNYIGSVANRNVNVVSSTVVEDTGNADIFNTLLIYVPHTFAESNLAYVPSVTLENPGVVKISYDNYESIMKGDLLTQWGPVFDGGANIDCTIIVVVFDNEGSPVNVSGGYIDMVSLTKAYEKTFIFGYRKFLFDPEYTGKSFTVGSSDGLPTILSIKLVNHTKEGSKTKIRLKLVNIGGSSKTITAGPLTLETSNHSYDLIVASDQTLDPAMSHTISAIATSLETGLLYEVGDDITGLQTTGDELDDSIQIVVSTAGTEYDPNVGTPATQDVSIVNSGESIITVLAGIYTFGNLTFTLGSNVDLNPAGTVYFDVESSLVGGDAEIEEGNAISFATGVLPSDVVAVAEKVVQGFDGTVDGKDVRILSGEYRYSTEEKEYVLNIPNESVLGAGANSSVLYISSTSVGKDNSVSVGVPNVLDMYPTLPSGVRIEIEKVTDGEEAVATSHVKESEYHLTSLALSNLVKNTSELSWYTSYLRIDFDGDTPDSDNPCKIRNLSSEDQLNIAPELESAGNNDIIAYYWAYLKRNNVPNTQVVVHCEADFILADVIKSWFSAKNSSGGYVGNKTFFVRLSGEHIKVFGGEDPLFSSSNKHDEEGLDRFAEMNIGVLQGVGDGGSGAVLTTDASIGTGLPCGAHMLSKKINYDLSKKLAQRFTDSSTVSSPVTITQRVYESIQNALLEQLVKYQNIGRIENISLSFPALADARTSRNSIAITKAWTSDYIDDLTTIQISGSITV